MKVSELFHSIQGEGKLMGVPSFFVRASGCNLRCTWCDTPYASWNPEGREMSVEELLAEHDKVRTRHVVLTGGEPMIMPDIETLAAAFRGRGCHITIETAATVFKPVAVDLASLSPKLANSTPYDREGGRFAAAHERQRLNFDVIQRFIDHAEDFQLKFVVSSERDMDEIHTILDRLRNWQPDDVMLMPEGTDAATLATQGVWIADICKQTGFRFCPRMHIELYGNTRGT